MAKKGLSFQNWVDIANPRDNPKCGNTEKRYPKCVPIAKAEECPKVKKISGQ